MKFSSAVCVFALLSLAVAANGLTTSDLIRSVIDRQEQDFARLSSVVTGSNKADTDGAYALIKYIVVPSKAKAFINVLKEAKEEAQDFKGYKAYDVVKTIDDNITYIAWAAWESPEALIEYIKSESSKKVIEYIASEDIVALISGVKPVV